MMNDSAVQRAVNALSEGKIILYPTDTVWGIGCDATSPGAVNRIFEIKRRPAHKSLVILIAGEQMYGEYAGKIPSFIRESSHEERPTSFIVEGFKGLAPGVYAPGGTVAVRIPRFPTLQEVIRRFGKPIVSTSANISGGKTPVVWEEIPIYIRNSVDRIIHLPGFKPALRPSRIIKILPGGKREVIRE